MIGLKRIKENKKDEIISVCETLLNIIEDILNNPNETIKRRLYLDSDQIANKLMPYSGGLETLFEMGFQEDEDSFYLPIQVKNFTLNSFKNEIRSLLNKYKNNSGPICNTGPSPRSINRKEFGLKNINNERFARKLQGSFEHVLIYENLNLKQKALNIIPIDLLKQQADLKYNTYKMNLKDNLNDQLPYDQRDFLLIELMSWFKNDFFKWINQPDCVICSNNTNMSFRHSDGPNDFESIWMARNVEVYNCSNCNQLTRFARYNHPSKLLDTRGGRCGEWANCFCLCLRSLDYDTRYILDWTDHVWCEVYSNSQKRWLHADPCENALDKPLIYEHGWNKNLSYILAFSRYECVDVTWRYSTKHREVMSRRNECDENWLVYYTNELSKKRQVNIDKKEIEKLEMRRVVEIIEFLTPKQVKQGEDIGRQSGSLQWRLARGEINVSNIIKKNFKIKLKDLKQNEFSLKYNTVKNKYFVNNEQEIINDWSTITWAYSNIKLKIEHDWKMCYLARDKGPESGFIEWYFDLNDLDGLNDLNYLKRFDLQFSSSCFESGEIRLSLIVVDDSLNYLDESKLVLNKNNDLSILSNYFDYKYLNEKYEIYFKLKCYGFKLRVDLEKGNGDNSWQHTQLFRQSLNDFDKCLFQIKFYSLS